MSSHSGTRREADEWWISYEGVKFVAVPANFGPLSSLFLSSMTVLSGLGQSQGGSIY